MAVTPNQPNQPKLTPEQQELREQVDLIDKQALGWKNILSLKLKANAAAREEKDLRSQVVKLGREEAKNATKYKQTAEVIRAYEKELQQKKAEGNKRAVTQLMKDIALEKRALTDLNKTRGGALMAITEEARRRKESLTAERQLIRDINRERGLGGKIMDLFRTKEARQKQIDIARARVGGGANLPPGKGGGGGGAGGAGGGGGAEDALMSTGNPYAIAAGAAIKAAKALMAPIKAVFSVATDALVAPFADAAALLTGEDVGIGGGKLRTTGASSILGGLQKVASSIPLIGGLLGGLAGIFKTIVEAVLGIEQGMFRAARALNTSVGNVRAMTASFRAMAQSSGNLALNETRMLESEIEIGNQLGINKQLSNDILANNVLLKEVAGVEAESRMKIAEASIITGRNATALTKSIIGTVGSFNKMVGSSFTFKSIMQEASKLTGVMGLTFAKYPEKITNTIMKTKALGMELQQLDGIGSSLLDFESSISKEMEAQILTGKEMNLTAAREAALNNDNAKLASEITKNVGNSTQFIQMNRIQQEAIAESVGLTANGLADILRKQELYGRLQATDLKTFHARIEGLEKQGKTQAEISKLIGQDAYNEYTRLSTAEKISEIMEKIKQTFIEFVKSSGLFDFITNPTRVNNFIKSAVNMLAGAVSTIGDIIAGILDAIAWLPFTDTEKWKGMASAVRNGTGTISGGMRASVVNLGGSAAPSVSETVESTAKQEKTNKETTAYASNKQPLKIYNYNETVVKTEDYTLGRSSSSGMKEAFLEFG